MMALAGPNPLVTLVPGAFQQFHCFQWEAKLWVDFMTYRALPAAKTRRAF
jgi:hypothetical protein